MLFYPVILDKMASASLQGKKHKKVIEGFTTAFPNAGLDEIEADQKKFDAVTDDVNKSLSEFARSKHMTETQTMDYIQTASRDNKYLNQNVRTNNGTMGYVTGNGVFKPYNSVEDANETMGKNGCPTGFMELNTGSSTYSEDGTRLAGEMPMKVGTPMVKGQQCGYSGKNIYVSQAASVEGAGKYLGCKRNVKGLTPFGPAIPLTPPKCPAGTFQCKGSDTGYCYDPKRDAMVSTYMLPQYDAPIGKQEVNKNNPFLAADGKTYLWERQPGFDSFCGKKPTVPPCPTGTAQCPTGAPGYCWDPKRSQMVTTYSVAGVDSTGKTPTKMALVDGGYWQQYNVSLGNNPFVWEGKRPEQVRNLQTYMIDDQFKSTQFAAYNQVYNQFRAAAQVLCSSIKNDQTASVTVISGGSNSNGATFTVTRKSDTTAIGTISVGGRVMKSASYTYNTPFPTLQSGFLADDGTTTLWKRESGYDESCGAEPDVPPVLESSKLLGMCSSAAQQGGFGVYGIKDGQCYLGMNVDGSQTGNNCVSMEGGMIGQSGDFAAYKNEGASNDGLYKYGYVTIDNKLKEYPTNMLEMTNDFKLRGGMKILNAKNTETTSSIHDLTSCEKACIDTFGNDCEAVAFNVNAGSCISYGKDSLSKGITIPDNDFKLFLREKQPKNDVSCPNNVEWVDSNVWKNLPRDGSMSSNTKCELGAATQSAMHEESAMLARLTDSIKDMKQQVHSNVETDAALQAKTRQTMDKFDKDIAEYQRLYEGLTNINQSLVKDPNNGRTIGSQFGIDIEKIAGAAVLGGSLLYLLSGMKWRR